MSDVLTAHYRHLETECSRLATSEASTDIRNHYLRMAENYGSLAEAGDKDTIEHVKSKTRGLVTNWS
jgi:hypothetical protein